ncbi:hypothetical protein Cgig2_025545 [Carnegiea gigantea]|uniref:Uncharacterized protein n=1 Tax=Carnegiea gigantea TaxID=171969 RepID=A0A9Q1K9S3_9CARY|nr:hypothetical protein Cgig2_025545 [Carnegiea gigantea]
MLKRPPPMTSAPKTQNARKYCEFHEQNGRTTAECRGAHGSYEGTVSLHGPNHEMKSVHRNSSNCYRLNFGGPDRSLPLNKEVASQSPPWKFHGHHHMGLPKEASISRETHHPPRAPNFGFRGQEVNPTGVICLPVRFGDKGRAKNVEVDVLDKLYFFGVPAFRLSPLTLIYIVDLSSWKSKANVIKTLRRNSTLSSQPTGSPTPRPWPPSQAPLRCRPWRAPRLTYPAGLSSRPPKSLSLPSVSPSSVWGSKVPEAAKSHDLAKSQTNSNLAAESATRKFVERAQVPAGVFPTDGKVACAAFRLPHSQGEPSLPPDDAQPRPPSARGWHLRSQRASALPTLALHKIKKNQVKTKWKGRPREPIPRLLITGFALPLLGSLHRFYHLDHKLRNRPQAVVLPYIIEKVASQPLLLVGRLLKGIPDWLLLIATRKVPLSRIPVDKDEVILPILHVRLFLNGCYITRSLVSLGALWINWTRPIARAVRARSHSSHVVMKEHMLCQDVGTICIVTSSNLFKISTITGWRGNRALECVTFELGKCVLCSSRESKQEGAPGNRNPSATTLRTDSTGHSPPRALGTLRDVELANVPSEEELVDGLSKEELADNPFEDGLKNRHRIGNLFGFPKLTFWGNVRHHLAINKGREARKLRVPAHLLGTDRHLKDIPIR